MSAPDKTQISISNYDVYQIYRDGKRLTRQTVSNNANKNQIALETLKQENKQKQQLTTPVINKTKGRPTTAQALEKKLRLKQNLESTEVPEIQKKIKQEIEIKKSTPEQLNLRKKRCYMCNFILCHPSYRQCSVCQKTFHENCYNQNPEKGTEKNKVWICSDCQPCSICECIKADTNIVKCELCQTKFHFSCGFGLTTQTEHIYCPQCIKCQWCRKGLKSYKYFAVGGEFLCSDCVDIKNKKQYCLVCKTVWINNDAEYKREYIQCVSKECDMWVHKDCDRILKDNPGLFKSYSKDQKSVYRCPKCREQIRIGIIEDTIRFLSYFDVDKLFWMVDYSNSKYLQVIKTPMDFVTLYQKNQKGVYKSASNPYRIFVNDVKLILDNCLVYHLPNTKFHRKAILLQAIYNVMFPKLKHKLFDLEEISILEYSEKQMGLVNIIPSLMRELGRQFLEEAFSSSTNNLITVQGHAWDGGWERQQLAFSTSLPMTEEVVKDDRLLVSNERKYNPVLQFEDKNEPLIKFSFREFANHLLQSQITIKVNDIKGLLSRSKFQAHPYLQYLITEQVPSHQKTDVTVSSQNEDNIVMTSEQQISQSPKQHGFESELQTIFTKILTKDLSKMKNQPSAMPTPQKLMTEFICQSCGTYEYKNNLLFCGNCGDSHHFFCQIQNANLVPLRVISSLFQNNNKQWQCLKCVQCQICQKTSSKQIDLFCQTCSHFYHFKCVYPQFQAIIEHLDFWRCPQCFSCEICKSKIYYHDDQLAMIQEKTDSMQAGSQLSLDYFQNFQYCLNCGLVETGRRFCDICAEYVLIDSEKEVVLPINTKKAYRQYLQPMFWEQSKQKDNIFNIFFEDINNLAHIQKRSTLNYLSKESQRESSHTCKRCQKRFHDTCLKQEGIEFNVKGFCQHCQLDYSDVLFKYERCKQEQVCRQYQEKKLKQVQPFLFFFLEQIHRKSGDVGKKLQYPELTEKQTQIVLNNLDQFEALIQQFQTSFQIIQSIKTDFFKQPDISDEFLEKLVQYWSLKFGSLEYISIRNPLINKEEVINYEASYDCNDRLLEFTLINQGAFQNYFTFQYLYTFDSYISKIFKRGCFPWHDILQLPLSLLQCNYVKNLVQSPYYQYVNDEFYFDEAEICDKITIPLLSFVPGKSGTEQIRLNLVLKQQTYKAYHQEPQLFFTQESNILIQYGIFRNEIQKLSSLYIDVDINEKFKQIIFNIQQLNICVLEMTELYISAQEMDNFVHETGQVNPTPVQKMIPQDQAKFNLEKVNKIILSVANQTLINTLLASPLDSFQCQICSDYGHRFVSGRLLYCDGSRWVHSNCSLWSNDVKENPQESSLTGVFQVLKYMRNASIKCNICTEQGASLSCISANCKKKVHFYCAYSNKYIFLSTKKIVCDSCILDVQAYCVDQYNQTSERVKSSLLKNVLTEVTSAQAVNDFSCWRKLLVINSQKNDKLYNLDLNHLRFGNTILLELSQSDNRPLFQCIRILINKHGTDQSIHKFLGIQYVKGEYTLLFREFTKTQLSIFLSTQMQIEELSSNRTPQNVIQRIFDSCDQFPLKSFQQLQQILQERKFFNANLGELITYEDSLGNSCLLFTQYVRTKLSDKSKLDKPIQQLEQLTQYHHWFLIDGVYEDLSHQARLNHLDTMMTQTNFTSETPIKQKIIHPTLMDLIEAPKFDKGLMSSILSPMKLVISPQFTTLKEKPILDKFTLQSELTPNDIFVEADLEVQNNYNQNVNEGERQKELEKNLKQEYQLIEQYKKKSIQLYVGPSRIHKYEVFLFQNIERIKQSELVIEYTGELIRNALSDERERRYMEKGFGDCYMFRATKDKVIDATFLGSQARYLNHSCDPNCASMTCEFNDQPKILMYAKREIQQNEELTYDYQFEVEADKISCYCGAKNCLGRLN